MKRVLSIDGGGIKGVFAASFLASLESKLPLPISEYFDLIVGTSTGGIIALGLGMKLTAAEILSFYEEHGPAIFYGNRSKLKGIQQFLFCKYDNVALRSALIDTFGERKLGESTKRLVIPSMNSITGEVHIFKTSHHPRFVMDYSETVVDVAMATSAAPTFFPIHQTVGGVPLIDGGMWANNPVAVATAECLGVLEWPAQEIQVLSLGCTAEPFNVDWGVRYPLGFLYWIFKLTESFMTPQSSGALGTAYTLLGHQQVIRISPMVAAGLFSLDGTGQMEKLKGLGSSTARSELQNLQHLFLAKAEPFQPVHSL